MDMEILWERVEEGIKASAHAAIKLSDQLASNPEVSGEEFESARLYVEFLEKIGYEVEFPFMGMPTAFFSKKTTKPGPKVCMLFEYDALPGIGHGCGHNVSGAMSALAAAGLFEVMEGTPGELVLVGTPAEETNGAKVVFSEKGLFDDVDLAMMIHTNDKDNYVGYRSLAMDALEFRFKGKPAHAAGQPWEGRNALNGLQLLFHAIDMLRQHVKPDVRMHGIISEGGLAPNIVPEEATGRFYFRATRRPQLDKLVERVKKAAEGTAMATETKVSWQNFEFSFDDMLENPSAERLVEEILSGFGVKTVPSPGPEGSSDMGNVSYRCPAIQPKIGISEQKMAAHTHEYARATTEEKAHEALILGARTLARVALNVFLDSQIRAEIRKDFEARISRACD